MADINELSLLDQVSASDLLAFWKTSAGGTRKGAVSALQAYLQANLTFPSAGQASYTTQYAAPSATGFSVAISASSGENVHLILTPTAGFAAGTITLPAHPGVADKQEVLVNCTQQVTTLTVAANGATAVTGEPSSLGADDFFRLKFDLPTATWYRIS